MVKYEDFDCRFSSETFISHPNQSSLICSNGNQISFINNQRSCFLGMDGTTQPNPPSNFTLPVNWSSGSSGLQGFPTATLMGTGAPYLQSCRGPTMLANNFTFTSPTATQYNSVLPPFHGTYSGLGATWQQPVARQTSGLLASSSPNRVPISFSAVPVLSGVSVASANHHDNRDIRMKHKRPSLERSLSPPPAKVYVTEEKMAAKLQSLYITNPAAFGGGFTQGSQLSPVVSNNVNFNSAENSSIILDNAVNVENTWEPSMDNDGVPHTTEGIWERFKLLEKRLSEHSEDEEGEQDKESNPTGLLKILCNNVRSTLEGPSGLNTLVALAEKKKREQAMQLVLWQPLSLNSPSEAEHPVEEENSVYSSLTSCFDECSIPEDINPPLVNVPKGNGNSMDVDPVDVDEDLDL